MTVIPFTRLSRADMNLLGNNVLPAVRRDADDLLCHQSWQDEDDSESPGRPVRVHPKPRRPSGLHAVCV